MRKSIRSVRNKWVVESDKGGYILRKKSLFYIVVIILGLLLITACSDKENVKEDTGKDNTESKAEDTSKGTDEEGLDFDPDEEITLNFMAPWSDQQIDARFKEEFEKKYPNITIEPIIEWTSKEELEKVYAKDVVPDVVLVLGDYQELDAMEAITPLDDMVEKSGLDLDVYRDGAIEAIRSRDPLGEDRLLGLPVEDVSFALFYNKDVFDAFGVEYPTDGMTWDELVSLVPKVTGERNGTEYVGLSPDGWSQAFQQLSVTGTDPETGEVLFVDQPEFAQYFGLIEKLISIPGNVVKDSEVTNFKAGNVAMSILTLSNIPNMGGEDSLNFDIVRFPAWADNPDVMPNNLPLTLAISPYSEHKAAAFKLLEFIATKEQQIKMAEAGVAPVVSDPEVASHLAGDTEVNIEGIYTGKPAEPAVYSKYGPDMIFYAANFLGTKTSEFIESYAEGKFIDINTFLREMEEEYEIIIEEKQAKE